MQTSNKENLSRGKSALDAAHSGISKEQEARLDITISDLYEVEADEAKEIHVNYHAQRLLERLKQRAMSYEVLNARDVLSLALQVASGEITEAAAVDICYRKLSNGGRYSFYS